uniref:Uncharacterized protein n=1 Tax=Pinguiococcus pyrenoidosus TaxID=172671 RepID=A0A7R9YA23_9STRA
MASEDGVEHGPVEDGASLLKADERAKSRESDLEDASDREDTWYKIGRETPVKAGCVGTIMILSIGLPTLVYLIAFSGMGYGEEVFTHTRQSNEGGWELAESFGPTSLGGFLATMVIVALVVMYLLDAEIWTDTIAVRVRRLLLVFIALMFITAVILLAAEYPYGPLCLLLIGIPILQVVIHRVIMKIDPRWLGAAFPTGFRDYLLLLPEPLILIATITLASWLGWVIEGDNEWSKERKSDYAEDLDCDDNQDCLGGFLLWISPLLCAAVLYFYAAFAFTFRPGRKQSELKILGAVMLLVILSLWVASSLAGVSEGLTAGIFFFALAALVAVGITSALLTEGGLEALLAEMKEKGEKAVSGVHPDWLRALFVLTAGPLVIAFFPISYLNQRLRKCSCLPCTKYVEKGSDEWKLRLTHEFHQRLERARQWNWTSVLRKVVWLGIAYQILVVVVSKFTVLFLAWLNTAIEDWSLGAIVGITMAVGLILFLLPPVPGAPIYVTAGILITASGRDSMGDAGAVCFAIMISLATKLIACYLQQVGIGGTIGSYVWIRQICMVNTPMIKCFRLILEEGCLTLSKVGILIGGPDWPTSVLCGILKIPLVQTQIGTLPAIILIAPCTMTGAFYYYSGEYPDEQWGTLAVIAGLIGGGVQTGSLVIATFYVDKVLRERRDEVDAIADDEEVKAADERGVALNNKREEVAHWSRLQTDDYKWMRRLLYFSAYSMIFACYVVTVLPTHCFRTFDLTDSVDEKLHGAAWSVTGDSGITKPLGNAVLVLLILSSVGLWYFKHVTDQLARAEIGKSVSPEDAESKKEPRFDKYIEEGVIDDEF